jgi:predicted acylesterase/phospholipase RssA
MGRAGHTQGAVPVWRRWVLLALVILPVGCSILPGHWRPGWNVDWRNQPNAPHTAASWEVTDLETRDGRFIGLTLSGGGSRAANLSAAVMLELQRLGLLDQVDVISAVSGGALPAAYYSLGEANAGPFTESVLRDKMGYSFQGEWLKRWLYPQNVFRYWLSDFTRSDIMVQVFNARLYQNKTFADLKPHPKLLLNSTLRNTHGRFTFTDETFSRLHSNLGKYEVANAVNATSAFPAIFDDVTLEDYADPTEYKHLYDGGPMDNLGVQSVTEFLLRSIRGTNLDTVYPNGCFILIVDAAPAQGNEDLAFRQSSRNWIDYFVNTNALDASDAMLGNLRTDTLKQMGIRIIDQDTRGVLPLPDAHRCQCEVRHLSIRHLQYTPALGGDDEAYITRVTRIPTLFEVTQEQQDDLYRAAKILIAEMVEGQLLPTPDTKTRCGASPVKREGETH